MRRLVAALAMVVAGSFAGPARAELTEGEVVRGARQHFPLVRAAQADRDGYEGDLQSAEGGFDASLKARGTAIPLGGYPQARADVYAEMPTTLWGSTFFAGYRWGSDGVAPYDGKLITNQYGEVRAGAAVPLWRNGPTDRRRTNIERAEAATEMGDAGIVQSQLDAARVAALRYWAWTGAWLRRDAVERLVVRAQNRARDVQERVASGDLPSVERVDAERSLAQRRQQLVAAERGLQQASIELSIYLADPRGQAYAPPPEQRPHTMPPLPVIARSQVSETRALGQRPELARLRGQLTQVEAEARLARNQLAPGIDVATVGSQDLGPGSSKRKPFELEVGLTIDIPIDTDAAEGRLRSARAGAARVALQQALTTRQILAELRDAESAYAAAIEREALAKQERELADINLEAERERLQLGESTVFMVDLREQAALEAAIREIDAAIDARRATVLWRAAAGSLG